MVVDDEPDVLQSLHDLFRRDYQVVAFERGHDALAALDGLDPPVVMSDQKMPGMSGVEFLRAVRLRRPDATRLLFTGYADLDTVVQAINEGHIFRYITKPWEAGELAAVVRQALEQHDLRIERRRLLEELRASNARLAEANRHKELFIEVASHELNTPVAVILGMVELRALQIGPDAPEAERTWLERIRHAGRRLASTVERMFRLLEADRLGETLSLEVVEVGPLLRRVVDDLAPFLEIRGQSVRVEAAPALGTAEVDPEKIADVLTNLLANAVKFTPDGGTILLRAADAPPDRLRVEVADSGLGIPQRDLPFVFEPFFTGHDTLHHSSGDYQFNKRGIGLGLNLVKRFVDLHGGSVEVRSEPGRGSTFAFELPRRHHHPGVHTPGPGPDRRGSPPPRPA
jgi:signal transduction histidine kinase